MEEGEVVVAKVHRHWIFIALRIAGLVMMLLLPWVIVVLLGRLNILTLTAASTSSYVAVWALWGLVLWAMFWQFWTTYYMDIWVVTNKRIIDIDYLRLFDRNIAMLRFERIQDVATRVQGIFGTLLHFGSVVVQTAGTDREFVIDQIANPESLRDIISRQLGSASVR